jgi:peptidoglycan/LPS O-acetylase OafA/YrhL
MKFTKPSSILLNLIRGISAQFVVIGHLFSFYNIFGLSRLEDRFLIQNFGVVVFFILSGCLIGYSVANKEEKETYTFKHFFIDRFSRIFIAFIPALFLIAILDLVSWKQFGNMTYRGAINAPTFLGNIFMLQDFPIEYATHYRFYLTSFGSGRPLWTVATEWWLYLFFGFLYFKKITYKNMVFLLPLLVVPLYNVYGRGNGLSVLWFSGFLVFYLLKTGPIKKNAIPITILLLAASLIRLRLNKFNVYDLAFSIPIAMALYVGLSYLQRSNSRNFLIKLEKPSSLLAAYSFSLYLLHYSIIEFVRNLKLGLNVFVEIGLLFFSCNLIAWLFAKITEYRYIQFRNYLSSKFL